jgi:hypothetical protein
LRLKTDSYALETNVHFPTGLNLLWDRRLAQNKNLRKSFKSLLRSTSQQLFKGKSKQ